MWSRWSDRRIPFGYNLRLRIPKLRHMAVLMLWYNQLIAQQSTVQIQTFFSECQVVEPSKLANEADLQKRLWDNSAKIVQISESEDEETIETLNSNLKEAAPTEPVEKVVEEVPKPSEIKEKDSSS